MNFDTTKRDWTPTALHELRAAVQEVMLAQGWSQAELGRQSTVPGGTLSQFMSGSYKGDNANVAEKLARFLDAHNTQREFRLVAPPEPTFIPTATSRDVQASLQYAQILGDMAVIVGPPGIGKTAALEEYVFRTPRVFHLAASPTISTEGAILTAFLAKYHPTHARHGRPRSVRSGYVRELLGPGTLFVLDEAQHATVGALEELRAIHDDRKCGLAIMGNPQVLSRIQGAGRDPAYAQIFGRVGRRTVLKKAAVSDVEAVVATMGVDAPEVVETLRQIAGLEDLRVVIKVTRSALLLAGGAEENLGSKHIRAAYKNLSGQALKVAA